MSRSIFGWSYPPGCSGPPDDDQPCVCGSCGKCVDNEDCDCPECAECGEKGCLEHMDVNQVLERFWAAEREITRRGGMQKIMHDLDGCQAGMENQDCDICGYKRKPELDEEPII